ncbi:branched-chain amino acid transport system II carrier protein [Vibrio sp. PP-XX7]
MSWLGRYRAVLKCKHNMKIKIRAFCETDIKINRYSCGRLHAVRVFLGAGNIIFPPLAGQLAGDNLLSAMSGFLLTAVGLPLISIIAVAIAGGAGASDQRSASEACDPDGNPHLYHYWTNVCGPRTGLVAFEMAVKPLFSDLVTVLGPYALSLFSVVFFAVAAFFSWSQGKLIDLIGKFLTPILFVGLLIVAVGVFVHPQGMILAAQGVMPPNRSRKGFLKATTPWIHLRH